MDVWSIVPNIRLLAKIYGTHCDIQHFPALHTPDPCGSLGKRNHCSGFRCYGICREKPFGYEFYIREKLSRIFLLLAQNRTELASHSQNESSQEMQHIKKMIRYIQNNYTESISLKQLAQTANICEREVQRSFRNVIRQSPIQYLIHYRIEKACHMLDSGEQSIIDICNSCGFSSPSYFTKTFKSIMGCTLGSIAIRDDTETGRDIFSLPAAYFWNYIVQS